MIRTISIFNRPMQDQASFSLLIRADGEDGLIYEVPCVLTQNDLLRQQRPEQVHNLYAQLLENGMDSLVDLMERRQLGRLEGVEQ